MFVSLARSTPGGVGGFTIPGVYRKELENQEAWKLGNLEVWRLGGLEPWLFGDVVAWWFGGLVV